MYVFVHAQMCECTCETKYLVKHHWHWNIIVHPSLFGLGMNLHPHGYGGVLTCTVQPNIYQILGELFCTGDTGSEAMYNITNITNQTWKSKL